MASIKTRVAHSHLGNLSNKELKKLFDAALVDLTAMRATVASLVTQHNSLVTDVQKISNNANAANNTVQVSAVAVTAASTLTLTS